MDRREAACVVLALLALALAVSRAQTPETPPMLNGDAAMHVLNVTGLAREAEAHGWLAALGSWRDSYPPLGFLPAALGVGPWVWLLLAGLGTYGMGRWLAGPPAGAVAAVLVVTSPAAVGQCRTTMLDLPLAALTAVSLWALVESERFSRRGWAWAAGATAGLALLTKWSWVFFGVPAWAPVLRWPAGPALAVAAGLSAPFYLLNRDLLGGRLGQHVEEFSVLHNLQTSALVNLGDFAHQALPALAGLLGWAAVQAVRTRDLGRQAPLWAALVGGCAITVAWMPEGPRYLLPAWPLATALAVAGLARVRVALVAPLAALAVWQVALATGGGDPARLEAALSRVGLAYAAPWYATPGPDPTVEAGAQLVQALGPARTVWVAADPQAPRPEFLQVLAQDRLFMQIYRGPEGAYVLPPLGVERTRRALPQAVVSDSTPLESAARPEAVILLTTEAAFRERAVTALERLLGPLTPVASTGVGEAFRVTAPRAAP